MNNYVFPAAPIYNASIAASTLDAAGELVSFIFQPIPGKTIERIWFRCTASTGGVVDVKLETTAAYVPTGTLVATGTSSTGLSVAANTSYDVVLTNSYTVPTSAQSILGATIQYNSGTSCGIAARGGSSILGAGSDIPRVYEYLNATGTQRTFVSGITVKYSDGTYHPGCLVNDSLTSSTYSSASNPDEYGNKFTMTTNRKCIGLVCPLRMLTSSSVRFRLYDSNLNVLTTDGQLTFDDQLASATSSTGLKTIYFQNPIYLSAGNTYYITKTAMNANSIYYYESVWGSTALKNSFHDNLISAKRQNDTGAFTEDSTKTEHLVPIFETTFSNSICLGG